MEKVFLNLFNMSISAGWVILAVVVLRFLLKRAPKNISVILWGTVGIRLICPFTIESILSLIPSAQTLAPEALYDWNPELTTGIPAVNDVVNPVFSESFAADVSASVNPLQVALTVAGYVWIIGMTAMVLYGIISYLLLRRKVATSVRFRDNIRLSDHVPTPFILGWVRPKIYIPSGMQEDLYEPVIAHEVTHIKRADHWIKLVGFVLLCVYWFQPLVWVAYILLCRDIELACDERVIREMDVAQKKDYSEALLACGMKKHRVTACPLAFGEVGVKQRIKAVLDYKKPALWVMIAAVAALVILGICFLTNPKTEPAGIQDDFEYEVDVSEYKAPVNAKKYNTSMIEVLKMQTPQYFAVEDMKGLEVYIWDENGQLWSGLMPGTNRCKTQEEIDKLVGIPLDTMAMVLDSYEKSPPVSLYVLGSSGYWGEKSQYMCSGPMELWLRNQLGLLEAGVLNNLSDGSKQMYLRYGSKMLRYRFTGQYASADQMGMCMTDRASNMLFSISGGVSSGYQQYGYAQIIAIKGEDTDRLIVTLDPEQYPLEIYELELEEIE